MLHKVWESSKGLHPYTEEEREGTKEISVRQDDDDYDCDYDDYDADDDLVKRWLADTLRL